MPSAAIEKQLASLQGLKTDLFQKDFLLTWERSTDEIKAVLALAEALKQLHKEGRSYRAFDSGLAISIFRDNSTRTRFSFASAASALGFTLADLDEEKSQIAHGETVRETANMISFLAQVMASFFPRRLSRLPKCDFSQARSASACVGWSTSHCRLMMLGRWCSTPWRAPSVSASPTSTM